MPLTDAQLMARREHICSTDVGAILGFNKYRSPFQVYVDKLNLVPPDDLSRNVAVQVGVAMEPVLLRWYQEDHKDLQVIPNAGQELFLHPSRSLFAATPDALVQGGAGPGGVEAKTAGGYGDEWGDAGTDVIPDSYLFQAHWNIGVLQADWWDVVVAMTGRNRHREYHIVRDPEFLGTLQDSLMRWWTDHIIARRPPPTTGTEPDAQVLAKLYPASNEVMLTDTAEVTVAALEELAMNLQAAVMVRKQAETNELGLENAVKAIIADNAGLKGPWGTITWRRTKDREDVDWKTVSLKLSPPASLIKQYTTTKFGSRRFLTNFTMPKK